MRRLAHRLRRPMRRLLSLLLTPLRGAPADALSDPSTIRQLGFAIESRLIRGGGHPQWLRDVMTRDTGAVFDDLDPTGLSAVEISGDNWRRLPWRQYGQLWFPAFDLCAPGEPPGPYDVSGGPEDDRSPAPPAGCRGSSATTTHCADPHTAVGVLGWEAYKREHPEPSQGLVLATAHPAKFAEVVMKAIGTAPPLPARLAEYLKRPKLSLAMSSKYEDFKQFLLS